MTMRKTGRSTHLLRTALLAGGLGLAPGLAHAQSAPLALNGEGAVERGGERRDPTTVESRALARGGYAVVIDLDQNKLFFKQGEETLWSAPIGTGTGLRLESGEKEWDFSTPRGVFHVQFKEENPVWIAPDWYFIENNLPVPPANDKKRFYPGGLGAAAVYIGNDLAIHGTDKPELLGQRVSHGCIRLHNRDAIRLFHNVQVGTEVVIVGGEKAREEMLAAQAQAQAKAKKGNDPSTSFDPKRAAKPAPRDPVLEGWQKLASEDLLLELQESLWSTKEKSRWPEIASILLRRGLDEGDDVALRGVLTGVTDLPTRTLEREYRTYLADAFSRGTLRTLQALSELDPWYRDRAAEAIVQASIDSHAGLDERAIRWPTSRVPKAMVEQDGRRGWYSLQRAEKQLRRQNADATDAGSR